MTVTNSCPRRQVVLLVRGRGTWARRASAILQSAGFLVHEAFSARDARDALVFGTVNFVISDMDLRDENGFRFITRARKISPVTEAFLASSQSLAMRHATTLASRLQIPGGHGPRRSFAR